MYDVTHLVDTFRVGSKVGFVEHSRALLSFPIERNSFKWFRLHLDKSTLPQFNLNIAKAYDFYVARTIYDSGCRVAYDPSLI